MSKVIKVEAGKFLLVGESVEVRLLKYPEMLLDSARKLIEAQEFSIAVVACHIACEVATEQAMTQAFKRKGIADLRDPVLEILPSYNLGNERVAELYVKLTGDELRQQAFWSEFVDSAKRRNRIIHFPP